jgi:hypothetical protein
VHETALSPSSTLPVGCMTSLVAAVSDAATDAAVVVLDLAQNVLSVNRLALALFGCQYAEVVGRPWHTLFTLSTSPVSASSSPALTTADDTTTSLKSPLTAVTAVTTAALPEVQYSDICTIPYLAKRSLRVVARLTRTAQDMVLHMVRLAWKRRRQQCDTLVLFPEAQVTELRRLLTTGVLSDDLPSLPRVDSHPVYGASPYTRFKATDARFLPPTGTLRINPDAFVWQGSLSSTTACTLINAMTYCSFRRNVERSALGAAPPPLGRTPDAGFEGSVLFLYWNARLLRKDDSENSDSGSSYFNNLDAIDKYGICESELWPTVMEHVTVPPPADCYQDAAPRRRLLKAMRVNQDLITLQTCIAIGRPVVFGLNFYPSGEADSVSQTGNVPLPNSTETKQGATSAMLISYNNETQTFGFHVPWKDFGKRGVGHAPYEMLLNPSIASEFVALSIDSS